MMLEINKMIEWLKDSDICEWETDIEYGDNEL